MKKPVIMVVALIAAVLLSCNTRAQQSRLPQSLLWEVSGNGLSKPSYIYGTIHMICDKDFGISDKVKRAFGTAGMLVLETNIKDPALNQIVMKKLQSDTPLSKQLSPEDYHLADSVLMKKCGFPLQAFENYQLVITVPLLAQKAFDCAKPRSYEEAFLGMLDSTKQHLGYLEGLDVQLDMLVKAYTNKQIIEQFRAYDSIKVKMDEMVMDYKKEDLNGLYQLMTTSDQMDSNAKHWLLDVRNADWAEKMPEMMKNGIVFFAVGAGHLVGPTGIIKLLQHKGYTVKPVMQ